MNHQIARFKRELEIRWTRNPLTRSGAVFLWGPRQVGKTTLLRARLPEARYVDLLDTDLRAEFALRPRRFREEILAATPETVVVDEIQEVPNLLPEIHWLLENTPTLFVLCGSSARKLRRKATGLLGGRATELRLHPLVSAEVPDLDLDRLLRHGGLPPHYLVDDPAALLRAYVNAYIKEEILDESATRNIPAFSRFLEVVALSHGQQMNYTNVARESGVSASTVRNYFQILEGTLLGFTLEPWRKRMQRRLVETAKFYLFDIGVANYLHPEARDVVEGTDLYGRAFEHFLLTELRAYRDYRDPDLSIRYWRTSSGYEVDFVLGEMDVVIESKSSRNVRESDLKGIRALREENSVGRALVVSREDVPRTTTDRIEVLPWRHFCEELWSGRLMNRR